MIGLLLLAMSIRQDPPSRSVPLPSANQMAWHARQYYAFVHFGPNTFSGNEWGLGTEDPSSFNPTALDCRQWARTFKEAGMSGVIITAKHHDGFALWPSKFTTHSVKSSKWRNGGGDVLLELSKACKEYGLWMGVYLSPWDRNHPAYGTDAYNDVFVGMLKEVLTQYGDMVEVWFDGANGEGPNGKRQEYDWERYEATVREYAPNAVIFGDGGDVRWVGNESGFVGETNWNFLPSGHWPGDQSIYKFLNEGDPGGDKYSPAECDVSIRPGWFWRASENSRVKSLSELKEIYYRSIGHGANLLLNVPPDTRGLIHENDVAALMEFTRWRDETFEEDLLEGSWFSSTYESNPKKSQSTSKSATKRWVLPNGLHRASYTHTWEDRRFIDHVVLHENVLTGQVTKKFKIFTHNVLDRHPVIIVAGGTTIGFKRIVHFPAVKTNGLTIEFESISDPQEINITGLEAYLGTPEVEIATDGSSFLGSTIATISSDISGAVIRYTINGDDPDTSSLLYTEPITITTTCTLKASAFFENRVSIKPAVMEFRKYEVGDLYSAIVFVRAPDPGLRYQYFEQGWQTLDQMKDAVETSIGIVSGLDISIRKRDEHFALRFDGLISAPADGIYTFNLGSDDGSRIYVDDLLVVDNDGLHGMQDKEGVVGLAAGYHRVRVEYFNAGGGMGLHLRWKGPGFKLLEVEDFFH